MHRDDLPVLKEILSHLVDPIEVIIYMQIRAYTQTLTHSCNWTLISPLSFQIAGLHPTAEQIEMFAYHLPDATLSNLVVSTAMY